MGGTTTQFLYDGLNPVQELAGGTPTANLLTGLGIDEYFTRTDAAGVRNYLTDALGSSVALTDGSGVVQTEYTEPFGTFTTSGAGTANAFAFTGREADGTGLYFYRARYYDPRRQRFTGEDPAGFFFIGYSWLLYAYIGLSATGTAIIMVPTALVSTIAAAYGWYLRCEDRQGRSVRVPAAGQIRPVIRLMFYSAVLIGLAGFMVFLHRDGASFLAALVGIAALWMALVVLRATRLVWFSLKADRVGSGREQSRKGK